MDWFDIYAVDALEAWRSLKNRVRHHPFMAVWFIMRSLGFMWFILGVYAFSLKETDQGLFADINVNTILFLIFIIFFAKSVSDTTRKIAQNKVLVFHLAQPVRQSHVLFGKMLTEVMINLGLFTLIVGLGVFSILLFRFQIPGDFWFITNATIITIAGTVIGIVFSIFNIFPFARRFVLMIWLIPLLAVFYYALFFITLSSHLMFMLFTMLTIISFVMILPCNRVFLEAWNRGTNPGKNIRRPIYSRYNRGESWILRRFMPEKSRALLKREIAEVIRSGEFLGMVIIIIAISYATIYALGKLENPELFGWDLVRYVSPMVLGIGMFAAALVEPGISTLRSIGREGKNLWILKSSPLPGSTVVQTKALSSLISMPLIVVGPGIFATVWAGYEPVIVLFSALGAVMMVLLLTGIGAWFGAKFPNFDESVKGYPDLMTLYIYSIVCLFFATIFCSVPLTFFIFDRFLGVLVIIFFVDLAALVLYLGIIFGGSALDKTEVY
jgi:hypothetical protein